MIVQSILDLIKSKKARGESDEAIINELVPSGLKTEDIMEVLEGINQKENTTPTVPIKKRKLFDGGSFLIIPIQIVAVVFTFVLCWASNGRNCSTELIITEIILFGLPILLFFLSIKESKNIENRASYLINNLIITMLIPAFILIFIFSK